MPFALQRDARFWISKLPGAFDAFEEVGTNYLLARMGSPTVLLPKMEKFNDAGQAGNGHGYATFQCNGYWLPLAAQIDDTPNFDLTGRIWLRALSGDVVDSVVSAGAAWKHAANQLPIPAGLQLKSFSAISELNGASSIHSGVVVDEIEFSQEAGAAIPRIRYALISGGRHRSPHQIGTRQVETATAVGTASGNGNVNVTITALGLPGSPLTIPVSISSGDTDAVWAGKVRTALGNHPVVKYFAIVGGATTAISLTKRHTAPNDTSFNIALANGTPSPGITPAASSTDTTAGVFTLPTTPSIVQCPGAKVEVKWTDPDGVRDFGAASGCPLRSWRVGLNNGHVPSDDRCATDPQQIEGDPLTTTGPGAANYLTKLSRNDQPVTAQVVILMDSIIPEFPKYAQNQVLTDVTYSILGPELAPGFPAKLTAIIPQARIADINEVDSNGKAALQIDLLPIYDPTIGGAIKGEVINGLDGASPDYN
jgi:hypothetical protein